LGLHRIHDDQRHEQMRQYARKKYSLRRLLTEERRIARYPLMNRRLHAARMGEGLTKRQVAACVAISPQSYWGYENYSYPPGIEIQCMLCLLFGKSADDLGFRKETRG
jgi:DNA-binding XRE family transcriptional regulator